MRRHPRAGTKVIPGALVYRQSSTTALQKPDDGEEESGTYTEADHRHAVISTFDLFSVGIGPSSSHTVGPMRAGNIFVADLARADLLHKVNKIRVSIYGSLALTGEGHMTPSALLLGLESADVETVDTSYVPKRFEEIKTSKKLFLGHGLPDNKGKEITFDYERDFVWQWGKKLPLHSNGMRLIVFDVNGDMLATNDLFSVGGGFVVNGGLSLHPDAQGQTARAGEEPQDTVTSGSEHQPSAPTENVYYKETHGEERRTGPDIDPVAGLPKPSTHLLEGDSGGSGTDHISAGKIDVDIEPDHNTTGGNSHHPRYPFRDAASLLRLCHKHNLTIAQLVFENEKSLGYSEGEIYHKLFRIWQVMDQSILQGVQAPADSTLPGSLKLRRRAPALYRQLTRGLYPSHTDWARDSSLEDASPQASLPTPTVTSVTRAPKSLSRRQPTRIHGSLDHPITPSPSRRNAFPLMDYLTVYAMAVNETNAAGGRIVTAPTNGAAGIIPAVLKYTLEFISDDEERDVPTFLLTAAAIGMLYKRGATISAAEGGCMAEVGVACSMAAGAFAACLGASPETIEQAAEIGIEHNLGLTCDPIAGLVQAPCIERNALGAIKAISSANLALSSETGTQKVSLDDAIRAMRLTAKGMRSEFKETSLSGLATTVPIHIPVSIPDC